MSSGIGALLTNYDEMLKIFYLPAIQEQLNQDNILSGLIDTNETDVSGKEAKIQCHFGRTKGTGSRKDGALLPPAGAQKFKTATVGMKYNYGQVSFSGPTIAATRDERGAYARVIDTEITGVVQDLQKEVNRQLWGCGYGVLARWRAGTTTSMQIQKKYCGNTAGGDGFGSTFGAKYFEENTSGNTVVATLGSGTGTTVVDTKDINVSAIAEFADFDTITIADPGVTEAAGTYYVRVGTSGSLTAQTPAGYGRTEMMGLRGIVTDEDLDEIALFNTTQSGATVNDPFQGLPVGTFGWWKAIVDTHPAGRYKGQRALNLTLMQKMFDKVERKAGKEYGPDLIITTPAIRREYIELMLADRRQVNEMKIEGGWKGISYNGVLFYTDSIDAIDGEIYFLTTKDLQMYRMSDYEWMDKQGAVLTKIAGYDAYEATLFRYAEFGCRRRNTQGVLCDLAYDAT